MEWLLRQRRIRCGGWSAGGCYNRGDGGQRDGDGEIPWVSGAAEDTMGGVAMKMDGTGFWKSFPEKSPFDLILCFFTQEPIAIPVTYFFDQNPVTYLKLLSWLFLIFYCGLLID